MPKFARAIKGDIMALSPGPGDGLQGASRRITPISSICFRKRPVETTGPATPEPATRPQRPQQLTFGMLEPLPPLDAAITPAVKPAPAKTEGDGGPVRGADGRDGPDAPANRETESSPAGKVVLYIEPEAKPSHDFRITAAHRIGQGGLHEKAHDNLAAIRLLKVIEAEDRDALRMNEKAVSRSGTWAGARRPAAC